MEDHERKLARLEARLDHLERELADERTAARRRRQRERWLRLALMVLIAVVYVLYFRSVSAIR